MAHLRGAIIVEALKKNLKLIEPSPKEIKELITGYGGATKEQVKKSIKYHIENPEILNKTLPYDVYDAIAIAITGLILESRKF